MVSKIEGRKSIRGLNNVGKLNPADILEDYDESEAYKEIVPKQEIRL